MLNALILSGILFVLFITTVVITYLLIFLKRHPFVITACILTANENIINVGLKIRKKDNFKSNLQNVHAIDESSGTPLPVLSVSKIGRMASSRYKRGGLGYIMLLNVSHVVKRGDRISLVIGDFRQEHLVVI